MKIHIFVLLISLTTLFSAILYAQEMPCQIDEDCPEGYICQQPEGVCVPALICTDHPEPYVPAICYETILDLPPSIWCHWTGRRLDICVLQ